MPIFVSSRRQTRLTALDLILSRCRESATVHPLRALPESSLIYQHTGGALTSFESMSRVRRAVVVKTCTPYYIRVLTIECRFEIY